MLAGDSAGEQYTHQRRRPALRPEGRDRLRPASRGHATSGAACPVRLGLRWRRHQRRAAVLLGGYLAVANDGSRRRRSFDADRHRRPVHGPVVGPRRSRPRGQPRPEVVVRRDQRHPAAPTSSRSSPAGRRRATTSRAARSSRTTATSTSTRRSRTSPTSGSPRRSRCRRPARPLSFWASYDTEADWDHLFVEARTPGGNDWTTLPDANGHTTRRRARAARRLADLHPQLDHYQTLTGATRARPTGTTGTWNAASGNSGGWQQWSIDLSAYAGKTVEISIAYASDWGTQGIGVFVDDMVLPDGSSRRSRRVSTAGRSPVRRRAVARTRTTSSARTPPASRSARRSPRRARCCWASGSRASAPRPNGTRSWEGRSTTCSTSPKSR